MTHLELMQSLEDGAQQMRAFASHQRAMWDAFNAHRPYSDAPTRYTYNNANMPDNDGGRTRMGNEYSTDSDANALLTKAQELQTAFWDAVRALEDALDVEIDSSRDLSNETIESLAEDGEEE